MKIKNNITLLEDHHLDYSIALTITKYNYNDLENITEYFVTSYHPNSIQFSLPLYIIGYDYSWMDMMELSRKLIRCFEIARSYGVLEGRISVQADAFILEYPRLYDCRSKSGEIILTPDGFISPCVELSAFRAFYEKWGGFKFNLRNRENFKYFAENNC